MRDPCVPSPCGYNSQCLVKNDQAQCSCLVDMMGSPPNCRPECISNSDCSTSLICTNQKCRNPCPASCGNAALCQVTNHVVYCTCPIGYTGDPFTTCYSFDPSKLSETVNYEILKLF